MKLTKAQCKLLLLIASNPKTRRLEKGQWVTGRKLKELGIVDKVWPFPELTEEGKKQLANLV